MEDHLGLGRKTEHLEVCKRREFNGESGYTDDGIVAKPAGGNAMTPDTILGRLLEAWKKEWLTVSENFHGRWWELG